MIKLILGVIVTVLLGAATIGCIATALVCFEINEIVGGVFYIACSFALGSLTLMSLKGLME